MRYFQGVHSNCFSLFMKFMWRSVFISPLQQEFTKMSGFLSWLQAITSKQKRSGLGEGKDNVYTHFSQLNLISKFTDTWSHMLMFDSSKGMQSKRGWATFLNFCIEVSWLKPCLFHFLIFLFLFYFFVTTVELQL